MQPIHRGWRSRGVWGAGAPVVGALVGLVVRPAGVTAQTPAQVRADVPAPATAFVGVNVVPMDREQTLHDQTVLVEGGRITALGPSKRVAIPAGARQIDGRGKFLLPGLADMHAHIVYTGDTTAAYVADELFALVANGITTIRDMHSGNRHSTLNVPDSYRFALRRRIAAGELLGPRIYTAGDPNYPPSSDTPDYGPSAAAAAAQSVAELKADGHDFVKVSFYGGELQKAPLLYDSILAVAKRVGLRVVGHVPPNFSVRRVLADHWASIEHLYGYRAYLLGGTDVDFSGDGSMLGWVGQPDTVFWRRPGYQLDQAKLRELAEATRRAGVWNCPTLYPSRFWLTSAKKSDDSFADAIARGLEFDLQITKALQDAGAGLLLGTDPIRGVLEGWGTPGFTVHNELAMLVEAGLTPYQALATGTRNAAEFLGTLDSSGTVTVGKRADLVLLNGNPLTDISYTAGPAGVMVQGRWLSRAEIDRRLDAIPDPSTNATDEVSSSQQIFYELMRQARQQYWPH